MKRVAAFLALVISFPASALAAQGSMNELPFAEAAAVSAEVLDDSRGASGFNPAVLSSIENIAVSAGNTLNNPVGGTNIISEAAFSGGSGIISVVQNSGNGVIIQNSTVVNLTMQ
ncbi:MAG: carbon storage regulator [Bdellovibrionales bacterium]